jgi:K+-transporting ATPase ATPase C chain
MLKDLTSAFRPVIALTLLYAALLGLAYPALLTGLGQALFPHQANGSLIREKGIVIGSELLGQAFVGGRYFHGRRSAAGDGGYDPTASAGSNLGPTSQVLHDRIRDDVASASEEVGKPIPADLVTTSASGLDPHISPEAAYRQVDRVAKARGIDPLKLRALVGAHVEQPVLGIVGEPRVTVLALNRALDRTDPR